MSTWIFVAVVFIALWIWWRFLNWAFDLIDQAHRQLRDQEWR